MNTIIVSKRFAKTMIPECLKYIERASDKQAKSEVRDLRECIDNCQWYPMHDEMFIFENVSDILKGKRGN